jgi:signal transduction histidine kinase
MRSIRLSLIVYFLVLLTAALGAVSWFSYRTTSQSLRKRQLDSQKMIEAQCETNCDALRADLDRRILRQALTMVNVSQSMVVHAEAQCSLFGMIGSGAMPLGYLNLPLFCYQATHKELAPEIFRAQPLSTHIESADKLVADEDGTHAQEYFQTYRNNLFPMERSAKMGDQSFTLDENLSKQLALHTEHYDEVELQHGVRVRRVTLKTNVPGYSVMIAPWPWKRVPPPNFWKGGPFLQRLSPKDGPKGAGRPDRDDREPPRKGEAKEGKGPGPGQPRRFPVFRSETPAFFIQYASDLGPIEEKIHQFQRERNEQLADLESTIDEDLRQLRSRMTWISLITLAALWLGGYLVIRLGLAPLSKMSEAVSQVSSKNFHLPLDARKLPPELQPIAARLVEVLEHLQKAFAREKQAAADISHELRTPLAALMTTLEVGLKKSRSLDEYREILDECRASGQHMYQLVERLMALARLDAGADRYRPAETDVTEIALQCADLIRPLAKARGLALRLHLPDPITMETDLNKLREVLVNLLHNAVEYNKPAGSIDLSIEHVNGHVRLEVRDTGIGIKPQEMGHLFERFYRADPSRHADTPHAGLGLAIVKSYIDLMGGTIRVESSDAGTAFIVELPFVASAPALETAVQAAPALAQR